jgi:hypothetical protein
MSTPDILILETDRLWLRGIRGSARALEDGGNEAYIVDIAADGAFVRRPR